MANTAQIKNILSEIKKLDTSSKRSLVEQINDLINDSDLNVSDNRNLMELNGLGAEIWKDVDVEDYIIEERKWEE